jgi:hypothetical protein
MHTATDNSRYTVKQEVPVTGGATYQVGGWVNIPSFASKSRLIVKIQWRGSGNLGTLEVVKFSAATSGWVEFSDSFVAPAGATSVRVLMTLRNLNGTALVDDFRLQR